jgi:hypothetical protein
MVKAGTLGHHTVHKQIKAALGHSSNPLALPFDGAELQKCVARFVS